MNKKEISALDDEKYMSISENVKEQIKNSITQILIGFSQKIDSTNIKTTKECIYLKIFKDEDDIYIYIGETGEELNERFRKEESAIFKQRKHADCTHGFKFKSNTKYAKIFRSIGYYDAFVVIDNVPNKEDRLLLEKYTQNYVEESFIINSDKYHAIWTRNRLSEKGE